MLRAHRSPGLIDPTRALALAAFAGIVAGGLLALVSQPEAAGAVWAATTALMLVPLTWSVLRSLARGDAGVDAIALLGMAGALASGSTSPRRPQ